MTRIRYDSVKCPRPVLAWEPEYANGKFYGYVIHTTERQRFAGRGVVEVPVTLAFARGSGQLVYADVAVTDQLAQLVGLVADGSSWRLPDAWLAANPHRDPWERVRWGEWYWEV